MKAITIHQPWASLVALGVKHIETRSWSTKYRGPIAIHAGLAKPQINYLSMGDYEIESDGRQFLLHDLNRSDRLWSLDFGAVIATAELVDCLPIHSSSTAHPADPYICAHASGGLSIFDGGQGDISDQLPYGDFTAGRYGWWLENITPIDPVRVRGRQGLWEWSPAGDPR